MKTLSQLEEEVLDAVFTLADAERTSLMSRDAFLETEIGERLHVKMSDAISEMIKFTGKPHTIRRKTWSPSAK